MRNHLTMKKEYIKGDIAVTWKPEKCIHSAICAKGLPRVFRPKAKPWVNVDEATKQEIIDQVNLCPSGALGIKSENMKEEKSTTKVAVQKDGPLLLHGECEITHADGSVETKERVTAFCRCGQSANKPFCDGAHKTCGFEG